jgi:hypothetical protein
MPTPTYTPLATVTLGSSVTAVTFSSIPATYRDLILITDGSVTVSAQNLRLRFNADSGNNYTGVIMFGTGTTTGSQTYSAGPQVDVGGLFTSQTSVITSIMDYSATDKHKTILSRYSNGSNEVGAFASRWASTSAITSIEAFIQGNAYVSGTTLSLYGVIA